VTTADGAELQAREIAGGLNDPTDLAFTPDGAVFIAERAGRVQVFRDGRLRPEPALTLADVVADGSGGALAVAVDPQFARNGYVYLVYTGERGFRLARFRAVADTLGERAILIDGLPASPSRPAAALRFGPDGRLYLGLDDAGDDRAAGDLGSFNGKILRINTDATTPADQAGSSPVFAANIGAPGGLDWDGPGSTLWVVDRRGDAGQLHVIASGVDAARGRRGQTITRYRLPDGGSGFGLAFHRGATLPSFAGNLLVAVEEAGGVSSILRMVFDPNDVRTVAGTERLLRGDLDGARALAVRSDGVIYFCTRTALFRLAPAGTP
jgi:glucose/arabinose dehydrogenase